MMTQVYAANLPIDAREETVEQLFHPFGAVLEIKLIVDRSTGDKRLSAVVTMENEEAAKRAIQELAGTELEGQKLEVCERDEVKI